MMVAEKKVTIYLEGEYVVGANRLVFIGQDLVEAITHFNLARDVAFSEEAEEGLGWTRVFGERKRDVAFSQEAERVIDPVSYEQTEIGLVRRLPKRGKHEKAVVGPWEHYDHFHVSCRSVTKPFSQHGYPPGTVSSG